VASIEMLRRECTWPSCRIELFFRKDALRRVLVRKRLLEDMLERYEMPYDKRNPMVCLDENSVVLHADVWAS
jgi:hypothetical protein